MKTISTAVTSHLGQEVQTLATCWKIVLTDGQVIGYTDNTSPITYASVVYNPANGVAPTDAEMTEKLAVDNMDVRGILHVDGIDGDDIKRGLYDYAEVYVFMIDYENPDNGIIKIQRGTIGDITLVDDFAYRAEVRSLSQKLQQRVGQFYGPSCRADFGDMYCGIDTVPDTWTASTVYSYLDNVKGTIGTHRYVCVQSNRSGATEPAWNSTIGASTTDGGCIWITEEAHSYSASVVTSTIHVAGRSAGESGYFRGGKVIAESGSNNGVVREIKSDAAGDVQTALPFPYQLTVGDVFTVVRGCDKTISACKAKAPELGAGGNIANFRGEPHIPGQDRAGSYGGLK